MSQPIQIVVQPQGWGGEGFHAQLAGMPEIWGCGKVIESAIGDLVTAHVGAFPLVALLDCEQKTPSQIGREVACDTEHYHIQFIGR